MYNMSKIWVHNRLLTIWSMFTDFKFDFTLFARICQCLPKFSANNSSRCSIYYFILFSLNYFKFIIFIKSIKINAKKCEMTFSIRHVLSELVSIFHRFKVIRVCKCKEQCDHIMRHKINFYKRLTWNPVLYQSHLTFQNFQASRL